MPKYEPHRFPFRWNIADGYPAKGIEAHNSTVLAHSSVAVALQWVTSSQDSITSEVWNLIQRWLILTNSTTTQNCSTTRTSATSTSVKTYRQNSTLSTCLMVRHHAAHSQQLAVVTKHGAKRSTSQKVRNSKHLTTSFSSTATPS